MSCNNVSSFNVTNETSSESDQGNVILSIILTIAGGALLSFSMVVQRKGLAHEEKYMTVLGIKVHRLLIWFLGMILYGMANAVYIFFILFYHLCVCM